MAGKPQKNLAYSVLLDFYGVGLTDKQRLILTGYYDEDLQENVYDEMEFVGIKPGKTTVTCTNTANKEKVTFTITVK